MTTEKLNIAFVWHMHQPFYKDLSSGEYAMPWVRLHGIKDYYDMVAILEPYTNIHQTFNLVPSLIEQILDYLKNNAQDNVLKLTRKPASELTREDKIDILTKLFMANWETMIKIYPRYRNLLEKRGEHISMEKLKIIQKSLTTQDFLDLQVWYNLAWFDPIFKKSDPELVRLINKNDKFTEEDKNIVINKQFEILSMILPIYKKFMDKGQIEVSISPYYHPILPLLADTDIARISSPYLTLPKERFQHIEDARWHIEKAVQFYKDIFNASPKGMWPSEGSVSEDIISLIAENGIKWIATDENILSRTLNVPIRNFAGDVMNYDLFYKAYTVEKNNHSLNIIFRDIKLSDKIGFIYSKWNAKDAVNDFMNNLHQIRNSLYGNSNSHLVSIILDGENAWEYYPDDGRDFLISLYERLNEEKYFQCVTVSEYIEKADNIEKLNHLFPGSWINNNFNIWIGHREDNLAWDYLSIARKKLVEFQKEHPEEKYKDQIAMAWKEIYIAEGSDWCWWYGDDHSSENDSEFDNLFRQHLTNIYRILGLEIPHYLYLPIKKSEEIVSLEPAAFINPIIDGNISHYYEWLSSGYYDILNIGGAMHRSETIIKKIYYGFNEENIYIRIDPSKKFGTETWDNITISLYILNPKQYKVDMQVSLCDYFIKAFLYKEKDQESWEIIKKIETVAIHNIIEISIPKKDIEIINNSKFEFMLIVLRENLELERWPIEGPIGFFIKENDYESLIW